MISNLAYQIERAGRPHDEEAWSAWVRRREATALPGAAAFLTRVRALGGKIAIVTNRREPVCEDTKAVFEARGLVYDAMLCRTGPSDKNPRFEAVQSGLLAVDAAAAGGGGVRRRQHHRLPQAVAGDPRHRRRRVHRVRVTLLRAPEPDVRQLAHSLAALRAQLLEGCRFAVEILNRRLPRLLLVLDDVELDAGRRSPLPS